MNDATAQANEPSLAITRVFDAPRQAVWDAWTDPEQIVQWSGPTAFTVTHWEADPRRGGAWRLCMNSAQWGDIWQGGVYHEISPPERLVFTFAWEENGEDPDHVMLITITFADLGDRTEMRFHQATFTSEQSRDSHEAGWSECFDKLAAHVAA
jgi:uncharacterized protein YndB with AHSA1/START domain